MKALSTYIVEANGEVRNHKFLKLMKAAGLEKVILVKGNGYHWITSDDDATFDIINGLMDTSIYVNSFNQQSPEQWVEDIKLLLKGTALVKEGMLSGIDNVMKAGDDYVKMFEDIKKEFKTLQKLKANDWEWVADELQYKWFCPAFLKYTLGVKADHIIFTVTTWEDDEGDRWTPEISMYVWREKDDITSNEFSIVRDMSFYSSIKRLLSGVNKNIKKTFADDKDTYDLLKSQMEKKANVGAFKN